MKTVVRMPSVRLLALAALGGGIGLLAFAMLVLLGVVPGTGPQPSQSDAVGDFGPAPTWALTDQMDRSVRSDAFAGKIIVADFIYTNCTDICPQLTAQMRMLQERLRQEGLLGTQVQLLSFTTDPARDTTDVLRAYAARYQADPDAWQFLTGPEATLVPLITKGFNLGVQALPPAPTSGPMQQGAMANYEVMHSGRYVMIDGQGRIRAYYDGQDFDIDQIVRDIQALARQ